MRRIDIRRFVWSAIVALGLSTGWAVAPVFAQTPGDAGTAQTTDDRDDDQDWGWIGLLGLAGLLGLRRRDHVDRVDTTTRPRV